MKLKRLNWSNLSIVQFQEIQELIADEGMTSTDYYLELADICYDDIPDEDEISAEDLDDIRQRIAFVSSEIKTTVKDSIQVGKESFALESFKRLSLAKFIEIDVTLTKLKIEDCVVPITRILYNVPESLSEKLLDIPITEVFGALMAVRTYREEVLRKYPTLFDLGDEDEDYPEDYEEEEIEEDEEEKVDPADRWLRTVFALAEGKLYEYPNIVNKPHILVFNWVVTAESVSSKSGSRSETE